MRYSELRFDNIDLYQNLKLPMWANEVVAAGGIPVSAIEFYDDLFGEDLEPSRMPEDYRTGEYGAIAVEIVKTKNAKKGKRYTITRGQPELYKLIDKSPNFCVIAAFSYAGMNRTNKNARYCFSMVIEIDDIKPKTGITELFYSWERENLQLPKPTYIVCSGTGVHLYFVFERPIPLYGNIFETLSNIKKVYTQAFWNSTVTNSWEKPQYESLNQGFRIVGTCCKDPRVRAMAFKTGDKVTCEYLYSHIPPYYENFFDEKTPVHLAEAAKKWPEWYKYRVEQKLPRSTYFRHPGIYYNWVKKIYRGAAVGHRYNCLENLCSLAVQCRIPPEEVEKDCREVAKYLETLTKTEDNHFTEYDVICALKTYYKGTETAFLRKREYVAKKTGIPLTPNIRKGNDQTTHLEIARAIRDIKMKQQGKDWRDGNGRPKNSGIKAMQVYGWRKAQPDGTPKECIQSTGISKNTVYKWWNWTPETEINGK